MKALIKLFSLSLIVLLLGCQKEGEIPQGNDPEKVAVAFFEALYNEKDVDKAAKVCSPQLARIVLHYRSPEAVGRHLFNMSYDSVTVTPDDSGVKVREQFKDEAKITLYFEGKYQDSIVKDVKRIYMVQKSGDWLIDKILKDPF